MPPTSDVDDQVLSYEHQKESPSVEQLVDAREITFSYSTVPVLNRASLSLPRGSIGGLIGANGSGKSTFLRVLAGLIQPSSGTVVFRGTHLSKLEPRERARHIAYVPQVSSTIFPFTALEVVLSGRNPYSGRFRFESKRDEEIAFGALEALDAAHLAARPITELSGGEQQLVTVARALAQEPEVMFLDEPASALDLKHRAQLTRSLLRLRNERGITVLTVTHDLMLLDQTFDLLFAMKCGRVVASGTPEAVLRDSLLGDIYETPVRTMRAEGRTFVWSEQ